VSGGLPRGEATVPAPAGGPGAAPPARGGALTSVRSTLEMIRFSHSVFALPFALLSLVLAAGGVPPVRTIALVVAAMVLARSAAMAFNRVVDRGFDARNPRTAGRHLVTGALSVRFAVGFTVVCSALFVLCAALLNPTALILSPAVLAVLLGYSYLKRVTSAAHFGVGLALGLSPLGAWVAGAGGLVGDLSVPLVLGAAVTLWVAGFDVIYACQDADVDRREGLRALPARLGVPRALNAAALCHVLCLVLFTLVGRLAGLGVAWGVAVALAAALLLVEHALVKGGDLAKVNLAFFTVNGVVALCLGAAGILDALVL
jgi:4-hydroxybenzoate polyprenyltransferase